MSGLELKLQLLKLLKDQQQSVVENLNAVVNDAQKSANEYGAPKDRYDSYRMQLLRKKDMFSQQLAKAVEQLEVLQKISRTHPMERVAFGALVLTDKQLVFVSIGLGKIVFEGEIYYAISPNVPFYKAMEGLKAGDVFEFRNERIKINAIY